MAMAGESQRQLDETPTWAVASVCAVIVLMSILLELVLHRVGEWFTRRRKRALFDALQKVKTELMILGFISLLLSFGQSYIARICIPIRAAKTMLPCQLELSQETDFIPGTAGGAEGGHHRRLLLNQLVTSFNYHRRILSGGASLSYCREGTISLISIEGIHQLHIFIFFLAVFHVVYSAVTMALGRLKIRGWKDWEKETSSLDYEYSNDPARFRFAHETSFVRAHTNLLNRVSFSFYFISFFRQFFRSVSKADYLTMRNGFIAVHLAPGTKFDFQKYIKRSLEDDFKVVVGVSPLLWASACIYLLLNVHGWQALFWVSLLPLIIILAVGTKLQAIIAKMALEIKERHAVVQGIPLVQIGDKNFWFGRPKLILHLIHFTLFQNAFEITFFLWTWYEFGLRSCFHEDFNLTIARVVLGVGVQFLCSYITLPLYALVSQMGSHMKRSIFDEQTSKALKNWHKAAKKKQGAATRVLGQSPVGSPSGSSSPVQSNALGTPNNQIKKTYVGHEVSDEGFMSPSQRPIFISKSDDRKSDLVDKGPLIY